MATWDNSQADIEQRLGRPLTWTEKLGLWWGGVADQPGVVGAVATGVDYYADFVNDQLGMAPVSDAVLAGYETAAPIVAAAWDWKKWIIGGGFVLLVIYLLGRLK